MKMNLKKSFLYIKEYGLGLYFIWAVIGVFSLIRLWPVVNRLEKVSQKMIMRYLKKDLDAKSIMAEAVKTAENRPCDKIWVFWYQGFDSAPDIVKACVRSIKTYCKGYEVIELDKNNINDFYRPEAYIERRLQSGAITITGFSDILRMNLLRRYGGYWIDATVFMTGSALKESGEFFTVRDKEHKNMASHGQWTSFFMGGSNPELYTFCCLAFDQYWKKHDCQITYFLIDYFIRLAYENSSIVRQRIDAVPQYKEKSNYLQLNLNKTLDEAEYKSFIERSKINKLTYKLNFSDNENTVYNRYILNGAEK